ncbi:MAG: glycosyltransferase [Bryobacteraceae bacterium]
MCPDISVVVSTYNRSKTLAGTIRGLLLQQGSATFELIVVDNNSTDDTAAVVDSFVKQSPLVRYVFEPKQGVSYGRNAGIDAAQSGLLLFTDDDVTPDPRWVERSKALFGKQTTIWLHRRQSTSSLAFAAALLVNSGTLEPFSAVRFRIRYGNEQCQSKVPDYCEYGDSEIRIH